MNKKWVKDFEKFFSIKPLKNNSPYLIIEGKQSYLQKINKNNLVVKVDKNKIECEIYNKYEIDTIAFLVKDWIKIQDSLEMIFNLLTGDYIKSLKMLAFLREKSISAFDFGCYLCKKRKVLLINRFSINDDGKRNSQLEKIKKIINSLTIREQKIYMLIVGNRAYRSLLRSENLILGRAIHPSGAVLNIDSERYYKIWYEFNNDFLLPGSSKNFELSFFHRL